MQSTDITIGPNIGFLAVLNLLGAAQGVLLALALLTMQGNKTANRLLAALTLTISIVVSGAVLLTSNYVFAFPHLSRLHQPFVFLAAPLLFLYLRELTARERTFQRKDFLHFIPFVLCLIYLLPYYLKSSAAKIQILVSEYVKADFGQWYYVRSAVLITQVLVYLVLIVINIVQYSRDVKQRKSPRDKAVLFEVRFFVVASVLLWCAVVLRYAIETVPNLLVPLGASLLIYAMGYLKMRRPEVENNGTDESAVRKYEKSRLTPERSTRYLDKLLNFMKQEKPFTDGDLTIQKLAEKLSIPAHHLSQTINERLGQTFSDFINSYRVEEAKKKLLDPALKHLSVLGIAIEVGFNSKSSFNSVFKKHTNMTPSEFRNASNGSSQYPDRSG